MAIKIAGFLSLSSVGNAADPPTNDQPPITAKRAAEPSPAETAQDFAKFVFPRSSNDLRAELAALRALANQLPADPLERERGLGLLRIKQYRLLCRLPFRDLSLDAEMNRGATAAADICNRLGKLTHEPTNPDLSTADFELARDATAHCNLAFGPDQLTDAVDMWMDDSDEGNIERLGHRRWLLNPRLARTGMGQVGKYFAMWAFDQSAPAPDYEFISFPPAGYVPLEFFRAHFAWSVTLNPLRFKAPDGERVNVRLSPVLDRRVDLDHALKIEKLHANTDGFGVANCLIFRPTELRVENGRQYWLEISGLERADGTPARLSFLVAFIE